MASTAGKFKRRAFSVAAAAVIVTTAATITTSDDEYYDDNTANKFYLDAPGFDDELPTRLRLLGGLRRAVDAGRQLYRESSYPKVDVCGPFPDSTIQATVTGPRMYPVVHRGRYGHE